MRSKLLKPLYKKVVDGLPGLGTPAEAAARFAKDEGSMEVYADRLIAFYTSLGGATGFVSGLPGFLLLPITLPANLVGVALVQLHMSAALAVMGGRDLGAPATQDQVIDCLLEKIGDAGRNDEEEEVVSRTATKLAEKAVRFAVEKSARLAMRATRSVALRKVGARRLPLLGGVLGAGSDAYVTAHVGRCAKAKFL